MTVPDGQAQLAELLEEKHNLSQLSLIGHGGMGHVYRAFDNALHRWVAVKVIRPEAVSTDDAFKRFAAEMRTLAGIRHSAVMNIHYSGRSSDADGLSTYFVMDYVPGGDLEKAITDRRASGNRFTVAEVDSVLRPVAQALDYLHHRQSPVIHRDLKPANILLPEDPGTTSVLTDFGISIAGEDTRLTSTGLVIGTEKYMAPEIFSVASTWGAHKVDYSPATDRYALALIAVEMLTLTAFRDTMSQRAWRGERTLPALTVGNLATQDAQVPGVAERVTEVFGVALNNDPGSRYTSAVAFLDALVAAVSPAGPPAQHTAAAPRPTVQQTGVAPVAPVSPPQRPTPQAPPAQSRRRTGRSVGILVTIVLLIAGTGLLGVLGYQQVLYPGWDSRDARMVEAFPDLLPERQQQDGWRSMSCSGREPSGDETARVVCADSSLTMVVVDFGDSDTRARYVSGEGTPMDYNGCVIDVETDGDNIMVFPGDSDKTRYAMILAGLDVDTADEPTDVVQNMPVC
ncbi:MAG: protein kinase [Corynebacterium sp.]|uniref:protein kinase domain-containing protein n=1 Tax=Corynebacterium TaxID=1716 RepID=UPI0026494C5A|nr:protein kinase [Corynebacterium sp.]MDN5721985.1 protein kinase [Corynebacterium sp.]MDN6282179.1 protein kinase [Corynebacterium sp.]MDN6304859.1 protein kinase [Corynebacterium sp.]MDN6353575.1 protein kinase [Corynebacterium sp.]MDN6368003.1 protein kinase [Corynebacterium sp.]